MKKLIFISFILLSSCAKFVTWDEFSLQRMQYDGTQLRIDGYYYQIEGGMYDSGYCFYRDGCLLDMGGNSSSLEEMDAYVIREFINRSHDSKKQSWGIYVIRDNTIQFERYYITDDTKKRSYVREGTILNDSTFHITTSFRSGGSEQSKKNEIYHFRQFSPKPDSTNNFIK